jgi:23S rRNA G2069 N7-methylase RlmK/C1962 C5-methylase RlmI
MDRMFDVQEDYPFLIKKALLLLDKGGVIFFSTNSRKFELDASQLPPCQILDVTKKTLPIDFRDPKIHQCWRIAHL